MASGQERPILVAEPFVVGLEPLATDSSGHPFFSLSPNVHAFPRPREPESGRRGGKFTVGLGWEWVEEEPTTNRFWWPRLAVDW